MVHHAELSALDYIHEGSRLHPTRGNVPAFLFSLDIMPREMAPLWTLYNVRRQFYDNL